MLNWLRQNDKFHAYVRIDEDIFIECLSAGAFLGMYGHMIMPKCIKCDNFICENSY